MGISHLKAVWEYLKQIFPDYALVTQIRKATGANYKATLESLSFLLEMNQIECRKEGGKPYYRFKDGKRDNLQDKPIL